MTRRLRFKPSLRETLTANVRALKFMALAAPPEKRAEGDAFLASMAAQIPPTRKSRYDGLRDAAHTHAMAHEPHSGAPGVDIDAIHKRPDAPKESEVVSAISQLLARHPRVLIALRMNSGMASYNAAADGAYQPVWFHKFLRSPVKMRMPDFIGFLIDGRPLAIEAKRPMWTKPRDDREREQEAFLMAIRGIKGIGIFATSADQVAAALAR